MVMISLMVFYILIGGVNVITATICALLILILLFKRKEYNYLSLDKEMIIITNLFSNNTYEYKVSEIEHIEFSRPMGVGSAIYLKVLTSDSWSKRHYIRLVSDKQLKEFILELENLNVPIEYNDIKNFIK